MEAETKAVVRRCTQGSDTNRMPFPQVVAELMAAGIERYHADLLRAEKTYYQPDGDSEVVPSARIAGKAALAFSAADVEGAVRAIQHQAIDYKSFCERILAAGCVGYFVSLSGRRAVYYGRTGDSYVEPFPAAD
jgi:uncharacterized protein YbcV (DUF1398 family)